MDGPGRVAGLSRRAVLPAMALGAFAPRAAHAQTVAATNPPRNVDDLLPALDGIARDAMQRSGVPGMAIAVVHQDRAIFLRGYGVRQVGMPEPVDADTVFPLASLSKPIAATVVAALVGDGVVGWDDLIIRHMPEFEMYDPWVTREVTLRDMFAHRSGLPDHAGDLLEDMGYERDAVLFRLRYQRPASSFRSHYAYTNFGFTAAAVAAARATGKDWDEISAGRLYQRLEMQRTSSRFADFAREPNRVRSHVRSGTNWVARYTREPDAQSPAGGVTSSVRDLANWMRLQLGRGKLDGEQIVGMEAVDETHRPQILRSPPQNPALDRAGFYGLGWNIDYTDQSGVAWGHSGAFGLGAATCVSLLPGAELGIVVLTNAQPIGVPEAICRSFVDLVLTGKVEKDWLTLFGQLFATAMAPNYGTSIDYAVPPEPLLPALPAAAYAGIYDNELYGPIEIAGSDGNLSMTQGPGPNRFPLRHFDRDVFTYQPIGENADGASAVSFAVGADRKAASATVENLDVDHQGSFVRRKGTL